MLAGSLPADLPHLARAIVAWVEDTLTPDGFSDPTVVLGLVDLGIRVAYERRLFSLRHREFALARGLDPAALPTINEIELGCLGRSSTIALWSWSETLDTLRHRGRGFLVVRPGLAPGNEIVVPDEENADAERLAGYAVVGELLDNTSSRTSSTTTQVRLGWSSMTRQFSALLRLVMDDDPGKAKLGSFARWSARMAAIQALASR